MRGPLALASVEPSPVAPDQAPRASTRGPARRDAAQPVPRAGRRKSAAHRRSPPARLRLVPVARDRASRSRALGDLWTSVLALGVLSVGGCAIDRSGLGVSAVSESGPLPGDAAAPPPDARSPSPDGAPPREDAGRVRDGGALDAREADAGADAGAPLGCIPAGYREAFRDDFDESLSRWVVDGNDGSGASWSTGSGRMLADSPSSGSDAVVDRAADAAVGVAASLRVVPESGAGAFRAGGLITRAASIDFAENDFYFCGFDPSSRRVILARYDPSTRVSSGQGFDVLAETMLPSSPSGFVLVTLCADGDRLACHLPELGVRLEARDAVFASGWSGVRTMAAETRVEWLSLHVP